MTHIASWGQRYKHNYVCTYDTDWVYQAALSTLWHQFVLDTCRTFFITRLP